MFYSGVTVHMHACIVLSIIVYNMLVGLVQWHQFKALLVQKSASVCRACEAVQDQLF